MAPAFAVKPAPVTPSASAPGKTSAKHVDKPTATKPIDINSASRTQLKRLPGIGDAEADRIVANRPYLSKAELVTKQVLPAGVYVSIRGRIIALQAGTRPRAGSSRP
jgi:DNA uptake protein ComE-like DNA-binding protein